MREIDTIIRNARELNIVAGYIDEADREKLRKIGRELWEVKMYYESKLEPLMVIDEDEMLSMEERYAETDQHIDWAKMERRGHLKK